MSAVVGVPKKAPMPPKDWPRIRRDIVTHFGAKALERKRKLDRAKEPLVSPKRTYRLPEKWFNEAKRIGMSHLHGLRLVL